MTSSSRAEPCERSRHASTCGSMSSGHRSGGPEELHRRSARIGPAYWGIAHHFDAAGVAGAECGFRLPHATPHLPGGGDRRERSRHEILQADRERRVEQRNRLIHSDRGRVAPIRPRPGRTEEERPGRSLKPRACIGIDDVADPRPRVQPGAQHPGFGHIRRQLRGDEDRRESGASAHSLTAALPPMSARTCARSSSISRSCRCSSFSSRTLRRW
jgi:hypothetical protein